MLTEPIYQGLIVVSVVLSASIGGYALVRRTVKGAPWVAGMCFGVSWWSLTAGVVVETAGTPAALLWSRASFLGVVTVVASLFLFALEYTGRDSWVNRTTFLALAVEPVVFHALVWTNGSHELVWSLHGPDPTMMNGFDTVFGPAFYAHTIYSYLVLGAATVWVVAYAVRSSALSRSHLVPLLGAVGIPWIVNVFSTFFDVRFDLTPIAFLATGILLTWAVTQKGFLDVVPVARDVVFETLSEAVVIVDTDDRIVDANPEALSLFGRSIDSLVGGTVGEVLADHPEVVEIYREIRDGSVNSRTVSSQGRHYRITRNSIRDGNSRLVANVFTINDVTPEIERQAALEERNQQLDQFAEVVSHDLRNPLAVASGYLEVLAESVEDDDPNVTRIRHSLDRMEAITDDVLALSRAGETIEESSVHELEELATRAWEHVDTGDATLSIDGATRLEGDRGRLLQLFENVFRNAIDHGSSNPDGDPDGRGASSVTVTVGVDENCFYVADDGPGIPVDERESVFEEGYTTAAGGTGLGLAIVRQIAEAHGWSGDVTESESGGARFEFHDVS